MQKIFKSEKISAAAYIIAALFFGIYAAAEIIPGFILSTAGRLFLLCFCCVFLWLGGVFLTKRIGNNGPMHMNLRIFLGLYLLLFATLTLFDPLWGRNGGFVLWTKEIFEAYVQRSLNLVPFSTIAEYFSKGNFRQFAVNIAGNFVCLMPLGILLPLAFKKQNEAGYFVLTCSLIVAAVEILQFITLSGSCDIDDLILNVGGAVFMFFIVKIKKVNKLLRYIFLLEKGESL